MSRSLFGTDGVRGRANSAPMTAEIAMRIGMAAGEVFNRGGHRHRVVIGKDTRLSGYMIEYAMVAGFTSVGMDVLLLGPMPTPAVAMLTKSMRADLGVMISASHNLFEDNGIKLFGPLGFKLSDDVEKQIEQLLDENIDKKLAQSASMGRARRIDGVARLCHTFQGIALVPHVLAAYFHQFGQFIVALNEQHIDVRVIQVLLGHAKLETTALYTRVATNTIRNVKSPLDHLIDKKDEPPA